MINSSKWNSLAGSLLLVRVSPRINEPMIWTIIIFFQEFFHLVEWWSLDSKLLKLVPEEVRGPEDLDPFQEVLLVVGWEASSLKHFCHLVMVSLLTFLSVVRFELILPLEYATLTADYVIVP